MDVFETSINLYRSRKRYATACTSCQSQGPSPDRRGKILMRCKAALAEAKTATDPFAGIYTARTGKLPSISAIAKRWTCPDAGKHRRWANKRRLFVLPQLVQKPCATSWPSKGEVTADVISAKAWTKAQSEKNCSSRLAAHKAKKSNVECDVMTSLMAVFRKSGSR